MSFLNEEALGVWVWTSKGEYCLALERPQSSPAVCCPFISYYQLSPVVTLHRSRHFCLLAVSFRSPLYSFLIFTLPTDCCFTLVDPTSYVIVSLKKKNAQRREKQEWAIEKSKLEHARKTRGNYSIDPSDEEYKDIIKKARRKLETPQAPAMPCKRAFSQTCIGETVVPKTEKAKESEAKTRFS